MQLDLNRIISSVCVSVTRFGLIDVGFFQQCFQRLAGGSLLLEVGFVESLSCLTSCSCSLLHVYTGNVISQVLAWLDSIPLEVKAKIILFSSKLLLSECFITT